MIGFEEYRIYLKQILGGSALITSFEIDGEVENTEARVKAAVTNLRLYISQGDWTKNKYQRFVMLNVYKTAGEISRSYIERSYKESSTRTLRSDGITKLMHYIPLEYLKSLVIRDENEKVGYILQRKTCEYFYYLANASLSITDFTAEYRKLFQFETSDVIPYKLLECKKEIAFISLFYMGYVDLFKDLDFSKLSYINSILSSETSEVNADAILILVELAKQIRNRKQEVLKDEK